MLDGPSNYSGHCGEEIKLQCALWRRDKTAVGIVEKSENCSGHCGEEIKLQWALWRREKTAVGIVE